MTRVLFLGNNYGSISITCLEALVAEPGVDVIVGAHDATHRGLLPVLRKAWSQYGARFVVRRCVDLALSTGHIWLRRAHIAPSGSRSLQELALVHRLQRFEFPLEPGMTEPSLRDLSSRVAARLLVESIRLARHGDLPRIKQDEAQATYYPLPPRGASRL